MNFLYFLNHAVLEMHAEVKRLWCIKMHASAKKRKLIAASKVWLGKDWRYFLYQIFEKICIRESFRVLPFWNNMFYWLFEKTRLPLRPIFGGFPVKLRTHIGEPIYPQPDMTPETMRNLCKVNFLCTKLCLYSRLILLKITEGSLHGIERTL